MHDLLATRPPWFVVGPLIGMVVIALMATMNARIGVLGGYSEVVTRVTGNTSGFTWKAQFLFGLIGGSILFHAAIGERAVTATPQWLVQATTSHATAIAVPVLLLAGALIGFGAKLAGGCTSGNGLGGCCLASPGSLTSTMTFMATAIGASFVIRLVTGVLA